MINKFWHLENLGRIRLSKSFFLRDFLHSEIGAFYGIRNVPSDVDLAVHTGRQLCEHLLEPIQDTFGRIHIRSGYRSPELNGFGSRRRLKCASNENTFADHIWDVRDRNGNAGACACVVVPWLLDRVREPGDWMRFAWWIHDHLSYHRLVFFAYQTAFNISWRDKPERSIRSFAEPQGRLTGPGMLNGAGGHADQYEGFPPFRGIAWPPASDLPPCNALHAMPVRKRAVVQAGRER
ncbi:hypothetical protein [Methylobacterium sp. A54F]